MGKVAHGDFVGQDGEIVWYREGSVTRLSVTNFGRIFFDPENGVVAVYSHKDKDTIAVFNLANIDGIAFVPSKEHNGSESL